MTFREAKGIIRGALAEASDAKLVELLDAARSQEVPYLNSRTCLAARLGVPVDNAYCDIATEPAPPLDYDAARREVRRQRILVPILLAEIRRRNRVRDMDGVEEVTSIAALVGVVK